MGLGERGGVGEMKLAGVYVIDLVLVTIATVFAQLLRDNFEFSEARMIAVLPYLTATVVVAAVVMPGFGITRMVNRFSGLSDYLRICAAAAICVLGALALTFMVNRMGNVSRSLPVIQGMLIMLMLVGTRVVWRLRHAQTPRAVMWAPPATFIAQETILVVGVTRLTDLYLRAVAEFAPGRVHVAGILEPENKLANRTVHQFPVLGAPEDVERVRRELEVHGITLSRIVIATRFAALSAEARTALLDIEATSPIKLELLAEQLGLDTAQSSSLPPLEDASGSDRDRQNRTAIDQALFEIAPDRLQQLARRPYWRVKRSIDATCALLLLVLLAPVMLVVALLVIIDIGTPFAFWQRRPGLAGQPFRLYKFRTMAAAHDADGRRVPDDNRLSPIGRFLRRTRLDELPQLMNIMMGEMSFIGPRPLLPVDQPEAYSTRLLVRPGLTGWAQVKGGRSVSPEDKAALDIWYVKKASMSLDLAILLQTVRVVLFGEKTDFAAIERAWHDLAHAGVWKGHATAAREDRKGARATGQQAA